VKNAKKKSRPQRRRKVTRANSVADVAARSDIPLAALKRALRASSLSARQLECLKWVAEGESSAKIAQRLGISADVVHEHVGKACRYLGTRSRTKAAVLAAVRGWLGSFR
jgi:LuxR family quorum-sensing system transcriptional regulator CciR